LRNKENAEFTYKTLGMYDVYKNSLEKEFKHLQNIMLAVHDLMSILAEISYEDEDLKIFRKSKDVYDYGISKRAFHRINTMRDIVESGIGQNSEDKGSALWLINGITSYYQNYATYKSNETKFDGIQNGTASRKLQEACNFVLSIK
jgi:hypothetical protein